MTAVFSKSGLSFYARVTNIFSEARISFQEFINPAQETEMPFHLIYLQSSGPVKNQDTAVLTINRRFDSLWYNLGVIWAYTKHLKSHAMSLGLWLQTDMS